MRRAAFILALVASLLSAGCTDLPEAGIVGRGAESPLAVFKECDEPDQAVGRLTVYSGDYDGPKLWSAFVIDKSKATSALPMGVPTDGYRTEGSIPRESAATFVFEATDLDGGNLDGTSFRWRDLRDGEVLLEGADRSYRKWPQWGRCN